MGKSYCYVCRTSNDNTKFRLPNPNRMDLQETFENWLKFISNPELTNKPKLYLYNCVRVCSVHFQQEDFITGVNTRKLKYFAVPTLYQRVIPTEAPIAIPLEEPQATETTISADAVPSSSTLDLQNPRESSFTFRADVTPNTEYVSTSSVNSGAKESLNRPRRKKNRQIPKKHKQQVAALRRGNVKLKSRLTIANNLSTNYMFQKKLRSLPKYAAQFIEAQLRNVGKRSTGRRFTTDEKIFSLSLYKFGPKAYRYYSQIFALPSLSTLHRLLKELPMTVGINTIMLQYLTNVTKGLKNADKFVSLMFDEIFLMPGLKYDANKKTIFGFEDCGSDRNTRLADHALVFMIRGLQANWKLPFAFYFSEAGVKSVQLVYIIKQIVTAIRACGLTILAIVCDQGANNVAAVNYLKQETRSNCIKNNMDYDGSIQIGSTKMFNLFDVPHLLKGVRNNMLTSDLRIKINNEEGIASWRHIEQMYEEDRHKDIRAVPKLCDFHVRREHIRKMKVKYCSQVFSQRVASQIQVLVDYASEDTIDKDAKHTAKAVHFFDQLFDSMNASKFFASGKPLRSAVTRTSNHQQFWRHSVEVLRDMYFIKGNKKFSPPSLKNWIVTVENTANIWSILEANGYKYFLTRRLNQDPLENFFAAIRSHGRFNTKPTTVQFTDAFKTLLINNVSSRHSINANCEDDASYSITNSINFFLNLPNTSRTSTSRHGTERADSSSDSIPRIPQSELTFINNFNLAYFSGYILKKIYSAFKDCRSCEEALIAETPSVFHTLIERREFQRMRCLKYPTVAFMNCINDFKSVIYREIPSNCRNIGAIYDAVTKVNVNLSNCGHNEKIKVQGKYRISHTETDPIKLAACNKYNKLRKRPQRC